MRNQTRASGSWVVKLVVINTVIFILQKLRLLDSQDFITNFSLIPALVISEFKFWQVFTYMFLHGDIWHIFLNMFILMNFGMMIEQIWGPKKFIGYYLFCGVGAGIFITIISLITGSGFTGATIGASGAIFGLLLAFAIFFPDLEILVFFIIPLKAKYFILLYGGIELYFEISGAQPQISHLGHLGGIVFGLIYFAVFEKMHRPKAAKNFEKKVLKFRKESKTSEEKAENNDSFKKNILRKLQNNPDIDMLTDDEYQFVKYLNIVLDSNINYDLKDVENLSDEAFISKVRELVEI